jgi:hypothetical protein
MFNAGTAKVTGVGLIAVVTRNFFELCAFNNARASRWDEAGACCPDFR